MVMTTASTATVLLLFQPEELYPPFISGKRRFEIIAIFPIHFIV